MFEPSINNGVRQSAKPIRVLTITDGQTQTIPQLTGDDVYEDGVVVKDIMIIPIKGYHEAPNNTQFEIYAVS